MKKTCLFLSLLGLVLFLGCNKEKELNPEKVLKGNPFLTSVKVAGARKVSIDTTANQIQIILPEQFKGDVIDIELGISEDAALELHPWRPLFSPGHVKYHFRGSPPEHFTLSKKSGSGAHTKTYAVFVKHEGPLSAELTSDIVLTPSSPTNARGAGTIVLKSGIGSIPEAPNEVTKVVPFIKNTAKNIDIQGNWDLGTISFEDVFSLMDVDGSIVGLQYGDKTFQFPQMQKLGRGPVTVHFYYADRLFRVFKKGMPTDFYGGIFLHSNTYSVALQNGRLASPVKLPLKTIGISGLQTQFPSSLPDDQYLLSFYEGTQLIGNAPLVIARDTLARAIGQMWVEESEDQKTYLQFRSDPITLIRGSQLLANPFPIIADHASQPFDKTKKIPDLALRKNEKITILKARVKEDPTYADHSIRLYIGAYRIPTDMPPGRYDAMMVLGESQYSLPYWSQIEIR
ncbi:hypothetical protein [Dyadobacter sp. OTU695]|uniref:hypothetical protein n=1 Tax=Dyadobacter sp. OTU695 TaxID=3043860 RepID=UPI00313B09C0